MLRKNRFTGLFSLNSNPIEKHKNYRIKEFLTLWLLPIKSYMAVSSGLLIARILGGLITILIARSLGDIGFASFSAAFFLMTILGNSTSGLDKTFVFQFVRLKGREKDSVLSSYTFLKLYLMLFLTSSAIVILFLFRGSFNFDIRLAILGIICSISYWILTYISSIYQALQKFKLYGLTQITYYLGLFLLVIIIFLLKINSGFIYISLYFLASWILIVLLLPFKNKGILTSKEELIGLLKKAKWLILSEIVWLIFIRFDYFTVSKILGPDELGNYALALRIINITIIFVGSLSLYILPKAAEIDSNKKLARFWKISLGIGGTLLGFNLILYLLAKPIVLILFGREYFPTIRFFRLMIIAYLPMVFLSPFKYLILRFNKEIHYFVFNGILLATYIIFLNMFVVKFGSIGPIFAKGVSFLATLLYGFILYNTSKRKDLK